MKYTYGSRTIQTVLSCCLLIPSISFGNCWIIASERYRIDPLLLHAIAKTESGLNAKVISKNKNGTEDVGLMQINTSWLPVLEQHGISKQNLLDPCINIEVGAWILAKFIVKFGNNWRAVGSYNAGYKVTPGREKIREKYAQKVYSNYVADSILYHSAK